MTRKVTLGDVFIGGDSPVSVQTMYDIPLSSLEQNFDDKLVRLKAMGCDIMRVSYPRILDHEALEIFVKKCPMPVVADIHFDYKTALDAVKCKVAGLRVNPGNIGSVWKISEIVKAAADNNLAIRIGLNGGSLNKDNFSSDDIWMKDKALDYIDLFEKQKFYNTVVSLKHSDTDITYKANLLFSSESNYPLHLGVTEAGGVVTSSVRTTWVLGKLLEKGIGNTIRYSISGSIEDEVSAGVELLRTLGLRKNGVRIISCPTCGRRSFDSRKFLNQIQNELLSINKNISVAIMGCQVNGPGEARNADVAVCGIGNNVYLYKTGQLYSKINAKDAKEELFKLIETL